MLLCIITIIDWKLSECIHSNPNSKPILVLHLLSVSLVFFLKFIEAVLVQMVN